MSTRPYLLVTGTLFGLIGLAHAVRAVLEWPFQIGILAVPRFRMNYKCAFLVLVNSSRGLVLRSDYG